MDTPARYLLFNGSIVLLIGLLCGAPYGMAIVRKWDEEVIRAWRLAHGALCLGATTMVAMAAILSTLAVDQTVIWGISISYIISGYGFCFALTLEPFLGARGLSWSGSLSNKVVYLGNATGALSSLIGSVILVYATYRSL